MPISLTRNPRNGVLDLAQRFPYRAQALAKDWTFEWSEDWYGDHSYLDQPEFEGYEVTTCEECALLCEHGGVLVALGCIDDAMQEYRWTIENDLAREAFAASHDIIHDER